MMSQSLHWKILKSSSKTMRLLVMLLMVMMKKYNSIQSLLRESVIRM